MEKFVVHVCLISHQPIPNLLPIFGQNKPSKAIFVVSKDMKKKASDLKKVFDKEGVEVSNINIKDAHSFEEVETQLKEELAKGEYEKCVVALNVTGGTKPMAISAQKVFTELGKPFFYVDTNNNRIITGTKDKSFTQEAITETIPIEQYFLAYGVSVIEHNKNYEVDDKQQAFIRYVIDHYDGCKQAVSELNAYVKKKTVDIRLNKNRQFFKKIRDIGLIKISNDRIYFFDENYQDFLKGKWFEYYVYSEIKKIEEVKHIMLNARLGNPAYDLDKKVGDEVNRGANNEFDVVFMFNNIIHFVECKTGKIKGGDELDKLQSLKPYGGSMTKGHLVSYQELDNTIVKKSTWLDREINIIQGKDIKNLKEKMENLLKGNKDKQ